MRLVLIEIFSKCIKPRASGANDQLQPHGRPGHRAVKNPGRPFVPLNRLERQLAVCVDLIVIRVVLARELTNLVFPNLYRLSQRRRILSTAGNDRGA